MAISFPTSPTPGQTYTASNRTWTWNGTSWIGSYNNTGSADFLDGIDSSQFLRSDTADTKSGNLSIDYTGVLYVDYNASTLYRASLDWDRLQLGNNGTNYIVGGRTSAGGSLKFVVNNTTDVENSGTVNGTTAMTITNGASVGIGTDSPSYKLHVNGSFGATSITETSSIAYKENVRPIENGLELIEKLAGVVYDRKDGSQLNEAGLIAEEVNEIIPNLVTKLDGAPEGIQYTKLTAYLIEAVKSLSAEVKSLKEQLK